MRSLLLFVFLVATLVAQGPQPPSNQIKPGNSDTIRANVYVDNWFLMYINGKLVAVDPIELLPHNQVSVDFLPEYPMTIAIYAKDHADPKTGLEYGNHIGDAGMIVRFADGTVNNALWKTRVLFKGPLNRDIDHPTVWNDAPPANWYAPDFDDSSWDFATEYSEQQVKPDGIYTASDFAGAKFIWSADLDLDNTVLFRLKVDKPGWTRRWNVLSEMDNSGIFWVPAAPACQTPDATAMMMFQPTAADPHPRPAVLRTEPGHRPM